MAIKQVGCAKLKQLRNNFKIILKQKNRAENTNVMQYCRWAISYQATEKVPVIVD